VVWAGCFVELGGRLVTAYLVAAFARIYWAAAVLSSKKAHFFHFLVIRKPIYRNQVDFSATHPVDLWIRSVDAGELASLLAGRRGRGSNSPPQLGQVPPGSAAAQVAQNVHSNEQIRAWVESGGRSLLQHSHPGRN